MNTRLNGASMERTSASRTNMRPPLHVDVYSKWIETVPKVSNLRFFECSGRLVDVWKCRYVRALSKTEMDTRTARRRGMWTRRGSKCIIRNERA